MPFTPFHFALAAPLKAIGGPRVSATAFIAINVMMDLEPGVKMFFGVPGDIHGWSHTLEGAIFFVALLGLIWRSPGGLLSLALGAISHLLLDAFAHTDLQPFAPLLEGNPLYLGLWHEVEAGLLIAGVAGLIAIWLKSKRAGRTFREAL